MDPLTIATAIRTRKFHYSDEYKLQAGIAEVLTELGVKFRPEFVLNSKDRIDFLVGDIGIEIKIDGALGAVTRQLWRYAECNQIKHLILVTTRYSHQNLPEEILGKTLIVVHLLNL